MDSKLLLMNLPFLLGALIFAAIVLAWPRQTRPARRTGYVIAFVAGVFFWLQLFLVFSRDLGVNFVDSYVPAIYAAVLDIAVIPLGIVLLIVWLLCFAFGEKEGNSQSEPQSQSHPEGPAHR
jgi:formate hydrogenlyase subunit 3/multisubunit Na+/H+ antiporter MnhD subunit